MKTIDCELPHEVLCALYGQHARIHYSNASWAEIEPRLHAGWYRIRGECRLDWRAALPRVKHEFDAPRTNERAASASCSHRGDDHATRREGGVHR